MTLLLDQSYTPIKTSSETSTNIKETTASFTKKSGGTIALVTTGVSLDDCDIVSTTANVYDDV